jgi:hypothetical protein
MTHFTFTSSDEDTTSSLSFNADFIGEVLEKFEQFLRGSGYHFEGNLEFVTNDDEYDSDYDDEEPVHDYAAKTSYSYGDLPTIKIDGIRPLTVNDIPSFQVAAKPQPTMAPLGPLPPNNI